MAGGKWFERRNASLPDPQGPPTNTHCSNPRCGVELEPEEVGVFRRCEPCRVYGRTKERRRNRRNEAAADACDRCGGPRAGDPMRPWLAPESRRCSTCIFKERSKNHFRSNRHWKALSVLFLVQEGRCAISGDPIVLGRNDSLDHRVPLCKGGAAALGNVWWTTRRANTIKSDQSLEELVEMLGRMSRHLNSERFGTMVRRLARAADDGGATAG